MSTPQPGEDHEDVRAIRRARERSNHAIAQHDLSGFLAELAPTYQVTGGYGALIQSRTRVGEAMEAEFASIPDSRYERFIQSIQLSACRTRAFELGTWIGTGTTPEGPYRIGGSYSAFWTKEAGAWKIRSELFATLH